MLTFANGCSVRFTSFDVNFCVKIRAHVKFCFSSGKIKTKLLLLTPNQRWLPHFSITKQPLVYHQLPNPPLLKCMPQSNNAFERRHFLMLLRTVSGLLLRNIIYIFLCSIYRSNISQGSNLITFTYQDLRFWRPEKYANIAPYRRVNFFPKSFCLRITLIECDIECTFYEIICKRV